MFGLITSTVVALLLSPPQVSQALQSETGVITGTLTTNEGVPLAKVRVSAVPVAETQKSTGVVMVSIDQTDDFGRYRLQSIPPGKYLVAAGFIASPVFYPGVTAEREAKIISVVAGQTLSDVNFSAPLSTSFGATVSGRVITIPGTTRLHPLDIPNEVLLSGIGLSGVAATVRNDGTFEFSKVPPGTYLLRTRLPGAAMSITVADRDLTNIELHAPFETVADGLIVTEDGSPLPDPFRLLVVVSDVNRKESTSVSSNGSFRIHLLEGDNHVSVDGLPLGFRINSISFEGRDIGLGPLRLEQKLAAGPIRITLFRTSTDMLPGFAVRGKALNVPAELFPAGPPVLRLYAVGAPILETPLRVDGTFEFPKVPAGKYSSYLGNGRPLNVPDVLVRDNDVEVVIDLQNNPFPEFPGPSTVAAFDMNRPLTLEGTITQPLTGMGPRGQFPYHYFRVAVNATPGKPMEWAVLMFDGNAPPQNSEMAKLKVGTRVRLSIGPARDGNPRGVLYAESGSNTVFGIHVLP